MKIVEQIDAWLIDRFQAVVDLTQLKPSWWVRWSGVVLALSAIIRYFVVKDMSFIGVTVNTLMAMILVLGSMSDGYVMALGTATLVRYMMVVVTVPMWIMQGLQDHKFPMGMVVTDVAWICAYYFAACKPPRPRKRTQTKPKLAFQ